MKDLTGIEWAIIAAILLILAASVVAFGRNRAEFQRVCDEARGTTVFDGRQRQCIKPEAGK